MAVDYDKRPVAQRSQDIRQPVCHYSSALNLPDGDIGEFDYQIIPWLRATMRDYMINRTGGNYRRKSDGRLFPGYPTGYLFAVDWLGGVWELRGFDFKSAANATSQNANDWTAPLLFVTDRYDPATDLQWAAGRAVWREFRRRSGRSDFANRPLGHGELPGAATACPGAALLGQLHAGLGDLNYSIPIPPTPPTPTPSEDDMVVIQPTDPFWKGALFTVDGHPVTPEVRDRLAARGELDIVKQAPHPHWDEATLHKMGEQARRQYGDQPKG